MSDLGPRLGVALALIGLAFAALWFGGVFFWLLLAVAGLLMLSEWADLSGAGAREKRLAQYALSVPLAILAPIAAGPGFFALGLLVGAFFFVAAVTRSPRLAAGIFYVGLPVMALALLRAQEQGLLLTLWAMALVWASDSGAYFAGRAIGGPKLRPRSARTRPGQALSAARSQRRYSLLRWSQGMNCPSRWRLPRRCSRHCRRRAICTRAI